MTGQKDKAVHHMQILVEAHPEWKKDRMLSYIISRNYIALNQKDRGLTYYQDYLSHDANPARGHLDYARFLTQSGKLSYNQYSQKGAVPADMYTAVLTESISQASSFFFMNGFV